MGSNFDDPAIVNPDTVEDDADELLLLSAVVLALP